MKRTLGFTIFALLTLAAVAAAEPPSMKVTLTLPTSKTLPGLSVPLLLHIRNGASAVDLSPGVRLRVTSPIGETFLAKWQDHIEVGQLEIGPIDEDDPSNDLKLPAKAVVELSVPATTLNDESWAHDTRLVSTPGAWKLEALLFDSRSETTFVSSPAILQIETPPASDVWIWQDLLRGPLGPIAEKVLAEQPKSPYFPYLATWIARGSSLEKAAILQRAVELHPNSPVIPALRFGIAHWYGAEADDIFGREKDLEKAVALAEKGRSELSRMKSSKDPGSRLKATRILENYPSREYFEDLRRLSRKYGGDKP